MPKSMTSTGAGQGGFRQAQAWLHTWCGLWFSWLLFAVFLTGTLAVFEDPISHWMTPEHHALEEAQALERASAPPHPVASLEQRLGWAVAYMQKHHPDAGMWELWPANAQGEGGVRVYWFDSQREYVSVDLDPRSGEPLVHNAPLVPMRATLGGHHFVDFHYQLHAGSVGLWLVGIAGMAMLVAMVSGVVTHRRIFKDFFTFRSGKGQRSWLDAHNALAVLTLPFQMMIAYTGIAISGLIFMPAAVAFFEARAGEDRASLVAALSEAGKPARSGQALAVPDLAPFALRGQALTGQPVRAVVVDHPGDAAARIGVYGWNDDEDLQKRLSATSGMAMFAAASGELLQLRAPGGVDGGAASLSQSVIQGLHMVTFGGWALKWLYFVCGLAGSAMMATGAILFVVKRRSKHLGEFGKATSKVYAGIEAMNLAAIVGLAMGCVAYLWANRLIPVDLAHRDDWELAVFFGLWALALLHALVRPAARAWCEQLAALALLCWLLPLVSFVATGDHLFAHMAEGDWESTGVEAFVLLTGGASAWTAQQLWRRQTPPGKPAQPKALAPRNRRAKGGRA